jgi:hypothetical protein
MKITLITTAIHLPESLKGYCENAKRFQYQNIEVIVVGDRKSVPGLKSYCESIARDLYPCRFLDLDQQQSYLSSRATDLKAYLRFDSRQRILVGLLQAWDNDSDLVILLDSRSPAPAFDFIGTHLKAIQTWEHSSFASPTDWVNLTDFLDPVCPNPPSPRGFPHSQIHRSHPVLCNVSHQRVVGNSGLSLGASDLSAAWRLEHTHNFEQIKPGIPEHFVLAPGTWTPFPAHNLALTRETIPAYFLNPYAGRLDDIWASFLLQKISNHLGLCFSFGSPSLYRSPNNAHLQLDRDQELTGINLSDSLCNAFKAIHLEETSFTSCFAEISNCLPALWAEHKGICGIEIEARSQHLRGLKIWQELFSPPSQTAPSTLAQVLNDQQLDAPLHPAYDLNLSQA